MGNIKIFLGGTCGSSTWRDELIPLLEEKGIDYFNPVVDNWDDEAQRQELYERDICDFCLYVITPEMKGFYSIAEVVDDAHKKSAQTVFCYIEECNGLTFDEQQIKSLEAIAELLERRNCFVIRNFNNLATFFNNMNNFLNINEF